MTDEWHINDLDLDAYLQRIGDEGDLAPTGATLARLHRAHVASIPFENLDIILGREISVELDDAQTKLVARGRGGYCYEHGVLFGAVLERLGYTVTRLLARVGPHHEAPRPRSHMCLRVANDDGDEWLADVGFGGGLLEPLPWGDTGPQRQGRWTYRMSAQGERIWDVSECHGEDTSTLYRFTEEPQHAADIAVANWFTSTHPSSPFVRRPVVMRKESDRQRRLHGRQLTVILPDGSTEQRQLSDSEVASMLEDDFGLRLTKAEVNDLLSTL